jgi:hypothetical protein
MNGSRTVARSVLPNAVEIVVKNAHPRVGSTGGFRQIPFSSFPAWQESTDRRMHNQLTLTFNDMTSLANSQRKPTADAHRTKSIKPTAINA